MLKNFDSLIEPVLKEFYFDIKFKKIIVEKHPKNFLAQVFKKFIINYITLHLLNKKVPKTYSKL